VLELFYATGIRVSELCGLDARHLDHGRRTVRVRGKGDKERTVPVGLPALRLRGLHAHLASGLDAAALLHAAASVITFARAWGARRAVPIAEINVGGGMCVDYRRPHALFDWQSYGRGLARLARPGEQIRVEPGRAVAAYCGWYVTRVLDVKRSHGETFAVVAGGTHHLRTPAAKGHDQPFAILPVQWWPHGWQRERAEGAVTLVGQLCTPKDVLARNVRVERLRAGDIVLFAMAGAYAWNISHHDFLMHPAPRAHYLRAPNQTCARPACHS